MRSCRFLSALLVLVDLVGLAACGRQASDARAGDEQAIHKTEIDAVRALNARDLESYMAAYPERSTWLPPNAPMVSGPDAIRKLASQLVANPGLAFRVQPTTVEVSRAGDLAYLVGSYELTLSDPKGNPVTDRGKYVEVWRKHPDNTWKHVLAIWNSDGPTPK
jgi:ketosteroid isomerase-like protein